MAAELDGIYEKIGRLTGDISGLSHSLDTLRDESNRRFQEQGERMGALEKYLTRNNSRARPIFISAGSGGVGAGLIWIFIRMLEGG